MSIVTSKWCQREKEGGRSGRRGGNKKTEVEEEKGRVFFVVVVVVVERIYNSILCSDSLPIHRIHTHHTPTHRVFPTFVGQPAQDQGGECPDLILSHI